jgi:hypothetical protein
MAWTMSGHAALKNANGRMSPDLGTRIMVFHTEDVLRFHGHRAAELSGSGITWGGSIMNYAHREANVQTTGWLICLNAPQPHLPSYGQSNHERSIFMKPNRTWILIADGVRARILQK